MPINPDAVGSTTEPVERTWTSSDCLLYALGVGAGAPDPFGFELEYTTENSDGVPQRVLPTFATVVGAGGPWRSSIGTFDLAMLLHAGQTVSLDGPIPTEGTIRITSTITGIFDKGSGALVVAESKSVDAATDEPRFSIATALFIRGEGGFGGQRGS